MARQPIINGGAIRPGGLLFLHEIRFTRNAKLLTSIVILHLLLIITIHFLAPPAERQRSFSNADSSVVRRPSSSVVVVNFSIKSLISQKLADNFLAPPAERQRSFSNADSSVVRRRRRRRRRRRPSSVVRRPSSTFQLKAWFLKNCLITFFLFWHVASFGWYQCIVQI